LTAVPKDRGIPSLMDAGGELPREVQYLSQRHTPTPGLLVMKRALRCCGFMGARIGKQAALTMWIPRLSNPSHQLKKGGLLFGHLKRHGPLLKKAKHERR